MKKKFIIIPIFIILLAIISFFVYYKMTFVKKTIEKDYARWDLLRYQNTADAGNYLGFLYDNNYDINTLPKDYVLFLLVNYYISYDNDFFNDNNIVDGLYQKEVSREELNNKLKEMFGPSYSDIEIEDKTYACGKSISYNGNNYIIKSKHPEVCGAFNDLDEQYIYHIKGYSKDKDKILINIAVAYMSLSNDRIVLYSNKNKAQVLDFNYSSSCLNSEEESCYNTFVNYQVTLKKDSDNNYYFNSISLQ